MAPLPYSCSSVPRLCPHLLHPGLNRRHSKATTRTGIRPSGGDRAGTLWAGYRQSYITMGTQLPMRGDDVLALSTLVDELTKCCKPLHQRQCVTARAYYFVWLASLVHPLSPFVPCRSASNVLEKQQLLCHYRHSPQVVVTLGHSKKECIAPSRTQRRPWEKMRTRERGHSRQSRTLRLKVRSVLSH